MKIFNILLSIYLCPSSNFVQFHVAQIWKMWDVCIFHLGEGDPMMNFPSIADIIFGSVNWDGSFGNFPILSKYFHFKLVSYLNQLKFCFLVSESFKLLKNFLVM
jgi:hypothetical protein